MRIYFHPKWQSIKLAFNFSDKHYFLLKDGNKIQRFNSSRSFDRHSYYEYTLEEAKKLYPDINFTTLIVKMTLK